MQKENKSRLVYMNGSYIPETEAKISIYDSALLFGDMVFEMTRSFKKKQFKLREGLERLYASIKYRRIPTNMNIDDMEKVCYEVVDKNDPLFEDDDEHRLMINVSPGGPFYLCQRIWRKIGAYSDHSRFLAPMDGCGDGTLVRRWYSCTTLVLMLLFHRSERFPHNCWNQN